MPYDGNSLSFESQRLPEHTEPLREEVRIFLGEQRKVWTAEQIGQSWVGFNREFSLAVGARGWIGMTWPRRYGGHERSWGERYIVQEEMLAVGAPVGAHWTGDRQTGPLLLRVGTEEQKQQFLPAMARGAVSICVGLSEPDTGSDLASIRSKAIRNGKGWRLDGRKIWSTNAHVSEYMLGLFRTGDANTRREGLSQFLIDLSLPGIEVRQIRDLAGDAHFNEVTFDNVQVPLGSLVGVEGEGWRQVTAELAFERSGPDRYMSSFPLLAMLIQNLPDHATDRLALRGVGSAVAELAVLREMSLSVAGQIAAGQAPGQEAALVKELGVTFEQSIPQLVRMVGLEELDPDLEKMTRIIEQLAPTYSLRGGTREIMLGIIARALGAR